MYNGIYGDEKFLMRFYLVHLKLKNVFVCLV